jgi:hypothetical protein
MRPSVSGRELAALGRVIRPSQMPVVSVAG